MKRIGEILAEARLGKKLSILKLERLTKIKSDFLVLLEKEEWDKLPPFPTVLGFVKSIAKPLGLSESSTVAILKRDYPPKKETLNPKPDLVSRFVFSPKMAFATGVVLVILILLAYLLKQYVNFVSPPRVKIYSPQDGDTVETNFVVVTGSVSTDVAVTINNQPVLLDQNGNFSVSIGVTDDTKEIEVKAVNRAGKETVVRRRIN